MSHPPTHTHTHVQARLLTPTHVHTQTCTRSSGALAHRVTGQGTELFLQSTTTPILEVRKITGILKITWLGSDAA